MSPVQNILLEGTDAMELLRLVNEAYEIGRVHPSIQVYLGPWMKKVVEFVNERVIDEPPPDVVKEGSNKYLELVRDGVKNRISRNMRNQNQGGQG